jgi:hypothetical protein
MTEEMLEQAKRLVLYWVMTGGKASLPKVDGVAVDGLIEFEFEDTLRWKAPSRRFWVSVRTGMDGITIESVEVKNGKEEKS